MTLPIELKKRFRVIDDTRIESWLEQFDLSSITRRVDEYYDTAEGDYHKKGVSIRLCNSKTLEIKFNQNSPSTNPAHCHEYRFAVPFARDQMSAFNALTDVLGLKCPTPFSFSYFLGNNRLKSLAVLDRIRKIYKTPSLIITVDTLSELGTFIEFEAKKTPSPYPAADFAIEVNLLTADAPLVPIDSEYVELALYKPLAKQTNLD